MKNLLTTLTLILAFAMPAGANWSKTITGTTNDCSLNPNSRQVCYFNIADGVSTNSAFLSGGSCKVTFHLNPDLASTATTDTEGRVRCCFDATTRDTSVCNPVITDAGDVTLNGDCTTGRCAVFGAICPQFYFDVTAAPAGNAARVIAQCEAR